MRLATIIDGGRPVLAVLVGERALPLTVDEPDLASMRGLAADTRRLQRLDAWARRQPAEAYRAITSVEFGPVVPDPGAIYTIGYNYATPGEPPGSGPGRPMVFGKASSSVIGHGAQVAWDRSVTDNVDAEVELGVVIGREANAVAVEDAMEHVFGYTCINDISSRDPWLDGDQWLIGKSLPGFCPVGPWIVTTNELDPADLAVRCTINGDPIQDGRTSQMRYSIPEIVAYLSRHLTLRPGDLIATGTPARLETAPGPGRRLQPGDTVSVTIEGIGDLTNTIA